MSRVDIRGIPFKKQDALPICYERIRLESGPRLDILVDDCVIIELKTVETVLPVHEAQVISYLKLTGIRIGFLLNFHVAIMKHGIKRFVL